MMFRFKSFSTVLFSVLTSATLFAADPEQTQSQQAPALSESTQKNICYTIGDDYYRCARARRYCFWDQEDGRCEPLNDTTLCGRQTNRWGCERHPTCFWDMEDGRCETVE